MQLKNIAIGILITFFSYTITEVFAIEEIKQGDKLTISDCIEYALTNSPQIKIYKENLKTSEYQIGKVKSKYFPRIGASAGYDWQTNNNMAGMSDYYGGNVSLNQLIYSFGKVLSQVQMRKFYKIAAQYNLDKTIIDTANNVKLAYYGVLAEKANLSVQKANVQINERQYIRTKAFFDEGLVAKIDLVNQEVNLSDAKVNLINAENKYQEAIIRLNTAMYIPFAPEYQIENTETFNFENNYAEIQLTNIANLKTNDDGTVPTQESVLTTQIEKNNLLNNYKFTPFPYTLEEAIKIAYEKRPDLNSIIASENAAKEALTYARREYLPDLTGSAGYNIRNSNYLISNGFSLSANLNMSSINFLERHLNIKEKTAELEIAKENVELTKQKVYFDVQNAYVNMSKYEKNIPLIKTKVTQALENYELADARYEVGLGNFIELQDAKQSYNNAQENYINTVFNYNVSLVNLQTAMGER